MSYLIEKWVFFSADRKFPFRRQFFTFFLPLIRNDICKRLWKQLLWCLLTSLQCQSHFSQWRSWEYCIFSVFQMESILSHSSTNFAHFCSYLLFLYGFSLLNNNIAQLHFTNSHWANFDFRQVGWYWLAGGILATGDCPHTPLLEFISFFFGKVRQTYSMLKITVLWKRVTLCEGNSSFFFFSWVLA